MFPERMNRNEKRLFALLLGAAALLYLYDLGSTGLWAPDEPRFAAVAEELRRMEHGAESLVVLRLSDVPYTQKPPLYYWLVAASSALEGRVNELTARLPSALAGVACIAITVLFGTAITRRPAIGLWSGAVLLTVFRFSHLARRAQLDVMLTAFITLALWMLFRLRNEARPQGRDFVLLHAALGLGVLTKGPVALLPIPAFALYLHWQGRIREFKRFFPLRSFALSLGPALAWLGLAVALTPTGYFGEAIVDNVLGRFFSGTAHVRPFYYFFLQFPLEFLPWTLLWPAAARMAWIHLTRSDDVALRDGTRWLLTLVGLSFFFFSFSAGKRGLYLLPTYPAVAILCGMAIDSAIERGGEARHALGAMLGVGLFTGVGFGAFVFVHDGLALERWPGFELPAHFGLGLALTLAACGGASFMLGRSEATRRLRHILPTVAALAAVQFLVFVVALPAFDAEKSPAPIAHAAARASRAGTPIGVFDHTAMKGGIAFYADRPVVDLRSEESLRAFLASGGEAVVVKASKRDRVPPLVPFAAVGSFRTGRREVVVLAPKPTHRPESEPPDTLAGDRVRARTGR